MQNNPKKEEEMYEKSGKSALYKPCRTSLSERISKLPNLTSCCSSNWIVCRLNPIVMKRKTSFENILVFKSYLFCLKEYVDVFQDLCKISVENVHSNGWVAKLYQFLLLKTLLTSK